MFATTDGANHWINPAPGSSFSAQNVQAILADLAASRLFAGTLEGVFESDDDGAHWQAINAGLTNLDVRALAIAPGGILLAGTGGSGVFAYRGGLLVTPVAPPPVVPVRGRSAELRLE